MSLKPTTSHQETPIWFEAGHERLFGIHTAATEPAHGVGVIIAPGGGTPLAMSVNDVSVKICRNIAAHGFDGFRFDYHGLGESTGVHDRFHLAEPFVDDLEGAAVCLRARGIDRLVLVGSCFGARTVLASADRIDGVAKVILLAPPVRDFEMGERIATRMAGQATWSEYVRRAARLKTLRNLRKADMRRAYGRVAKEKLRHMVRSGKSENEEQQARYEISPRFLEPLRSLVESGVPLTIVFGDGDELLQDFERARTGALGDILSSTGVDAEVIVVPGKIHGFTSVEGQDRIVEVITNQLIELPHG